MIMTVKTLAAAGLLAAAASVASAAPASIGQISDGMNISNNLVRVHGNHRSCERGARGWHRHNRFGERRPCREWHGRDRRPDSSSESGRSGTATTNFRCDSSISAFALSSPMGLSQRARCKS